MKYSCSTNDVVNGTIAIDDSLPLPVPLDFTFIINQ